MPNILVYDTSCSTGVGGGCPGYPYFLAHSHPTSHCPCNRNFIGVILAIGVVDTSVSKEILR